jgi:hypothetical protein
VSARKPEHDHFLADLAEPRKHRISLGYFDGFRFGLGFIMANLLTLVIVGALAWGVVLVMGLNK